MIIIITGTQVYTLSKFNYHVFHIDGNFFFNFLSILHSFFSTFFTTHSFSFLIPEPTGKEFSEFSFLGTHKMKEKVFLLLLHFIIIIILFINFFFPFFLSFFLHIYSLIHFFTYVCRYIFPCIYVYIFIHEGAATSSR